jgi:hypothetical protein
MDAISSRCLNETFPGYQTHEAGQCSLLITSLVEGPGRKTACRFAGVRRTPACATDDSTARELLQVALDVLKERVYLKKSV